MNPIYLMSSTDSRVRAAIERIKRIEEETDPAVRADSWKVEFYDDDAPGWFMELPQHTTTLTRNGKSITFITGLLALYPQFCHSDIKAAGLV